MWVGGEGGGVMVGCGCVESILREHGWRLRPGQTDKWPGTENHIIHSERSEKAKKNKQRNVEL